MKKKAYLQPRHIQPTAAPILEELGKTDRSRIEQLIPLFTGETISIAACLSTL